MASSFYGADGTNGTVSVTNGSPNVAGTGTAWLTNKAIPSAGGFAIVLPDGKLYPVKSCTADGSITLDCNYSGQTLASGGVYFIVPVQGWAVDLITTFNAMARSSAWSQILSLNPSDGDLLQWIVGAGWQNTVPTAVLLKLFSAASEINVASAAAVNLGGANVSSPRVCITGVTAVQTISMPANSIRIVRFAGALVLTAAGVNRTTAAGDRAIYVSDAGGAVTEFLYVRAATDHGDLATKTSCTFSGATFTGVTAFPGGLVVSSGGAIGLGTAAPGAPIDFRMAVAGAANFILCRNTSNDATAQTRISLYNDASAYAYFQMSSSTASIPSRFSFVSSSGDLTFAPSFNANALTISAAGIVGIGTSSPNPSCGLDVAGNILPHADNSYNIGSASFRMNTIFAATGAINTSTEAAKQDIRSLSDAELTVARSLLGKVHIFRFRDAVEKKGDAARLHAGMIYEEVVAAFSAQGLEPARYGIVCCDPAVKAVTKTRAVIGPDGKEVEESYQEFVPDLDDSGVQKTICGLRYTELSFFLMAALSVGGAVSA